MLNQYFLFCLVAIAVSSVVAVPDDDGRIVNGAAINIKQASYMVRLSLGMGSCGGSLIASNYVLTAAHCIEGSDLSSLTVVANITKLSDRGIERKVVRMAMHPDYAKATLHSDIAVLELDEPIYGMQTLPLCEQQVAENDMLQVSGWGRLSENGSGSQSLQTAIIPVRSKADCDKEYHRYVVQNMFCAAGTTNVGYCRGDSGGPGVVKGQVCGIVSFAWHCGQIGSQQTFTDVYSLRGFVEDFMSS